MCGRYSIYDLVRFGDRYGVDVDQHFEPRYNAAPGQTLPVVVDGHERPDQDGRADTDSRRDERLTTARWGFVPSWSSDGSDSFVNARAETAAEKRSFRDAYAARRCLVPADGFYEWRRTADGSQPYRVTLADGAPFAMAGLWTDWTPATAQTGLDAFGGGGPDREPTPVRTFAVLTTAPNELVADLHDRMAVALDPADARRWLDGDLPHEAVVAPYPAEEMRAYPVSTAVNDTRNDSPGLIEEVGG